LYRDVIEYSSKSKVVDLSVLNSKKKAWVPQKQMPAHQAWVRKMEGEKLQKRVKGLVEKSSVLQLASLPKSRTRRFTGAS